MTDRDDKIDSWLRADVEPLLPGPGAFDQIRRRARRRKTVHALVASAGVAVVIAGAVALPQVIPGLLHNSGVNPPPLAASGPAPAATRSGHRTHSPSPGHVESSAATSVPAGTSSLSAAGSGQPVPANFQPTSVTFVGPAEGAVIGQAGTPGHCATQYCTSLAGTSNYGASWYGVSAPLTGPPEGSTGVSQVRFLNTADGWAFGPALFVTHDGGAHWTREDTLGLRVIALETAGSQAFALFASCTGSGAAYGAHCTSETLYSSAAATSQWQQVPGAARNLTAPSGVSGTTVAGSLVLSGGTGYLIAPSGQIYSGPLTGAAWQLQKAGLAACGPGPAGQDGQPANGFITAVPGRLYNLCNDVVGNSNRMELSVSTDGGKAWHQAPGHPAYLPAGGTATSMTSPNADLVVVATTAGVDVSTDGGARWSRPLGTPPGASASEPGFSYVGMTDGLHGVAVPADQDLHEVYITTDGGLSWHPSVISAP